MCVSDDQSCKNDGTHWVDFLHRDGHTRYFEMPLQIQWNDKKVILTGPRKRFVFPQLLDFVTEKIVSQGRFN